MRKNPSRNPSTITTKELLIIAASEMDKTKTIQQRAGLLADEKRAIRRQDDGEKAMDLMHKAMVHQNIAGAISNAVQRAIIEQSPAGPEAMAELMALRRRISDMELGKSALEYTWNAMHDVLTEITGDDDDAAELLLLQDEVNPARARHLKERLLLMLAAGLGQCSRNIGRLIALEQDQQQGNVDAAVRHNELATELTATSDVAARMATIYNTCIVYGVTEDDKVAEIVEAGLADLLKFTAVEDGEARKAEGEGMAPMQYSATIRAQMTAAMITGIMEQMTEAQNAKG